MLGLADEGCGFLTKSSFQGVCIFSCFGRRQEAYSPDLLKDFNSWYSSNQLLAV